MTEPQPASSVRAMSEPHDMLEHSAIQRGAAGPGRWIVLGVALLALVLLALFAALPPIKYFGEVSPDSDFPGKGRVLAGLVLEPLVGTDKHLVSADLEGKVVLLNLWGPWCTYCHMEMPLLVAIHKQYQHDPNFQFVSVSCSPPGQYEDREQLQSETQASLDRNGYDFAVHWDPNLRTRRALLTSAEIPGGSFGYPTTVILDRAGRFQGLWSGYGKGMEKEMTTLIDELLQ